MFKKIFLIVMIIMTLLLSSCAYALNEWDEEHEFYPVDFVFCYNDHNTTEYEGDIGLKEGLCFNTIDNKTYSLGSGELRGIAYATKKTFKFEEPIIMTHSSGKEPKVILTMKYKNGTIIPELDYDTQYITKEQLSYFDDYYNQRSAYYENKNYWQQGDIADSMSQMSKDNNYKTSNRHVYVGTNGYGYIRDF